MMPMLGMASMHRLEDRPDATDPHARSAQLLGGRAQAIDLGPAATERLHDQSTVEALVRDPRHLSDPFLDEPRRALRRAWCRAGSPGRATGNNSSATSVISRSTRSQADHCEPDQHDHPDAEREGVQQFGGAQDVGVGVGQELHRSASTGDTASARRDRCSVTPRRKRGLGTKRGEGREVAAQHDRQPAEPRRSPAGRRRRRGRDRTRRRC